MPLDTFQRYHVIGNIHSGCLVCKHWTNVNKAIKSQGDVLNQNLAAIFFTKVQRNPFNNPEMILQKLKVVSVNCLSAKLNTSFANGVCWG